MRKIILIYNRFGHDLTVLPERQVSCEQSLVIIHYSYEYIVDCTLTPVEYNLDVQV